MKRTSLLTLFMIVLVIHFSSGYQQKNNLDNLKIAFMADIHFHDVYAQFSETDFRGVKNPANDKYATIRTMKAQLHSTRLFNENYFAFLAALNDIVQRGVKYVILPGDFSDDGQPVHVNGLKKILDEYSENYGLRFFATTGNHDPVRPFTEQGGKRDFLGEGGKPQPVISNRALYRSQSGDEYPPVITPDIKKLGYMELIEILGDYGFYPKKEYLYWETPFSNYDFHDYQFSKASEAAKLENRNYPVPPKNYNVPDVSYLVEPLKDLWLLAIDANVYIPRRGAANDPSIAGNYSGASIGYNNVKTHKKHLFSWIESIMTRAEKYGKTVIVFSHYPVVDFHDNATAEIENLLLNSKMQTERIPDEDVAEIFADAGVKLHFGGHIHINDSGIRSTKKGNTIVNVQIPSLAAYIPAYKLLTIRDNSKMEIETIVLDTVNRFNELFEFYKMEHKYLEQTGDENIWDLQILSAENYREYTAMHLKQLVSLRFLHREWPEELINCLMEMNGEEILRLSISEIPSNRSLSAHALAGEKQLSMESFREWTGFDLVYDLYRLRSADQLAIEDIGKDRMKQYRLIMNLFLKEKDSRLPVKNPETNDFQLLAKIFLKFSEGEPADHFMIDTKNYTLQEIVQ